MKKHYSHFKILDNNQVCDTLFTLKILAPEIANNSSPGQFINIYFDNDVKIFPRPFSISQVTGEVLYIRYKIIGSQTKKMSTWEAGEKIKILGPLGNSFDVNAKTTNHILVGGGIGVAPLFYLRDKVYNQQGNVHFFVGAASEKEHYIIEDDKRNYILLLMMAPWVIQAQ